MIDWEKVKPQTAIHILHKVDLNYFLGACERKGLKMTSGKNPTEVVQDAWNCMEPCIAVVPFPLCLAFGEMHSYVELGYKIIEYSNLVIANEQNAKDLPRISYLIGGEKTPIMPHEKIHVYGAPNNPHHFGDDMSHLYDANGKNDDFYVPFIINHPDKIVRNPQFSEDSTATMRQLVKVGLPWLARDGDGDLYAFSDKPIMTGGYFDGTAEEDESVCAGVPNAFFPQITPENSPFDCEAYLKSHE